MILFCYHWKRCEMKVMKKVAIHTLGCRLNFSETALIAQGFVDRGYQIVPFGQEADVVFINTCTVTDRADSTCRNLIRKAVRSSPEAKIIIVGCYAQMEAEKVKAMEGVDLVLGTHEKYHVFDYLEEELKDVVRIEQTNEWGGGHTTLADHHTRAFLKIQDGCNYVCSFCIIPFARGRSRAISLKMAIQKAEKLTQQGFKEIVLTGVNIGEYQASSGEKLATLLQGLSEIKGLERIRLSSVEPNTITDELLETLSRSPKFLDHFHIPLQSGDDQILKAMRRKYDTHTYCQVVKKIKSYFPYAGIGADIIAGFPGESQDQFRHTFSFLEELPITHFHIFPYSKRKKTTAIRLPNHIQYGVKKKRVRALLALGEHKLQEFSRQQVGRQTKVLFEKCNSQGMWEGYSSNFIKVCLESHKNLKNKICMIDLIEKKGTKLYGKLSPLV